jgi:hypothetical protein
MQSLDAQALVQESIGEQNHGKTADGRRMQLRDAAEAHVLGQKGGIGKILLLASHSQV